MLCTYFYSKHRHITQTTQEMFEWENRCASLCFERQAPKITAVFTIPTEITGTKGRPFFSSGNKASTRIQPHSALKGLKVWFHLVTIVWQIFVGEIKSLLGIPLADFATDSHKFCVLTNKKLLGLTVPSSWLHCYQWTFLPTKIHIFTKILLI